MKITQLILAILCFALGFVIAGFDQSGSPITPIVAIAAILGVSILLRRKR